MSRLNFIFIKKRVFGLVNICCGVALIIQVCLITEGYFWPDITHTDSYQEELHEIEFPVLFRVCIEPGFVEAELIQAGYDDFSEYFHGRSRHNTSIFGWSGHMKNGQNFTEKGEYFVLMTTFLKLINC